MAARTHSCTHDAWPHAWLQVSRDFLAWKRWLSGDIDPSTQHNWFTWNRQVRMRAHACTGQQVPIYLPILPT